MGQYFGNVQPVGIGNAFIPAFQQAMNQARQNALLKRSLKMQDEDRATAKTMQALQLHEQYPGTTLLPTSFRDIGPGTLPNPVDNLQIGKVEPGQPLPVSSGAGMEFGPGYVTDLNERQRVMEQRLQQSLAAAFAGAQAKAAGTAAGNPLAGEVSRSTIAKNYADAAKASRVPPVSQQHIVGADGSIAFFDPTHPVLPSGFRAATPAGEQSHFTFPVGEVNGKPTIFRANTKTGDISPTGADAKAASATKGASTKEASYVALMENALPTMQALIKAGKVRPWAISAAIAHPTLGNANLTQDEQTYMAAAKNFLAGTLHQESGARLSNEQWQIGLQRFFPTMGDSQETMEQKLATAAQTVADRRKLVAAGGQDVPAPDDNPYR